MAESFSDKLAKLLKNSEVKKYVDITLKKDSHIDFSEFKKELDKTKIKEAKNRRFNKLNEKRYKLEKDKKSENKKVKKNNINSLFVDEDEVQSESDEDSTKNKEKDDHPNIFFLKDNNNNDKMYTFHRAYKEYYYL